MENTNNLPRYAQKNERGAYVVSDKDLTIDERMSRVKLELDETRKAKRAELRELRKQKKAAEKKRAEKLAAEQAKRDAAFGAEVREIMNLFGVSDVNTALDVLSETLRDFALESDVHTGITSVGGVKFSAINQDADGGRSFDGSVRYAPVETIDQNHDDGQYEQAVPVHY